MAITIDDLRRVIPHSAYQDSLGFAHSVFQGLPGAEYEAITPRQPGSVPSVYLGFRGTRVLSFDLRTGPGARIYFWMSGQLDPEFEDAFEITTERGTGWKGFSVTGPNDACFPAALVHIRQYWEDCTRAIEGGLVLSRWRRQGRVQSIATKSFPDEEIVCNKKSLPDSDLRPDIHLIGRRVVIEVDGLQHFRRVDFFQATTSQFEHQRERDRTEERQCAAAGLALVRVVEDAADVLTAGTLLEFVHRAERELGVWYVVRKGAAVEITRTRPLYD